MDGFSRPGFSARRHAGLFSVAVIVTLILMAGSWAPAAAERSKKGPALGDYHAVVTKVARMVEDSGLKSLASAMGLDVISLTWEDTGRAENSNVGPNISDMTIQVLEGDAKSPQATCMPVIRCPNFADKTGDIPMGKFMIRLGNERGKSLKTVALGALLEDPRAFMTDPKSWPGKGTTFLAERDTHLLVSAQACFLPIPKQGSAKFNPVLFNYQSVPGDPAVLAILATREGTSMTIIDNQKHVFHEGGAQGQRLFFNNNGQRASLTGQRLSEFTPGPDDQPAGGSDKPATPKVAKSEGLNLVLLIQVPLKRKRSFEPMPSGAADSDSLGAPGGSAKGLDLAQERSDVEAAVIGHGDLEGPYTECDGIEIERDPQFPIRVTVQFYKATSNGVVSEQDLREIKEQIDKVYADATYVGSLVVPATNDPTRPTDWKPTKPRL